MVSRYLAVIAALILVSAASAQVRATPPALGWEDTYQIDYFPSLNGGNYVNLSNAGYYTEDATAINRGFICANIYVYNPDEEPRNCCACPLSANAIRSLTGADLAPSAFGFPAPDFRNFSIKIVATRTFGGCNASQRVTQLAGLGTNGTPGFATGLRAWATKAHLNPTFYTETKFSYAPLSPMEYDKLTNNCRFFQQFGTGAGICRSCALGARGPETQ